MQITCPTMIPEGKALLARLVDSAAEKADKGCAQFAYHGVHEEVVAERNKGLTEAHHMRCAGAMAIALLGQLKAEGKIDINFG